MQHRERYRSLVPEDAYIISFSDLLVCRTQEAAKKIAKAIYYPLGGNWSSDAQKVGSEAHKIKENELSPDWINELKLAYKMFDGYYLVGGMDRYYFTTKTVEDFKTTEKSADIYLDTNQIETYSFLAMNNDMTVTNGRYTMIDPKGDVLDVAEVPINAATVVRCYSTFILPRFNMIKNEIERLKNQYV